MESPGTGFGFSWIYNDKLIVGSITKGSMTESKGLKLGDEIVNINDENFSQMDSDKWCEILKNYSPKTDKLILTILRGGEKINYVLSQETFLGQKQPKN